MSPELAGLLHSIDLAVLGARLRAARVAKGMKQSEVAGEDASTAYISRIESGHRRPDIRLLEKVAVRAGTSLEQLLAPDDASLREQIEALADAADMNAWLFPGSPSVVATADIRAVLAGEPEAVQVGS